MWVQDPIAQRKETFFAQAYCASFVFFKQGKILQKILKYRFFQGLLDKEGSLDAFRPDKYQFCAMNLIISMR